MPNCLFGHAGSLEGRHRVLSRLELRLGALQLRVLLQERSVFLRGVIPELGSLRLVLLLRGNVRLGLPHLGLGRVDRLAGLVGLGSSLWVGRSKMRAGLRRRGIGEERRIFADGLIDLPLLGRRVVHALLGERLALGFELVISLRFLGLLRLRFSSLRFRGLAPLGLQVGFDGFLLLPRVMWYCVRMMASRCLDMGVGGPTRRAGTGIFYDQAAHEHSRCYQGEGNPMTLKFMPLDEQLAVLWWAAMSDPDRIEWLRRAGTGHLKDCWHAFQREQQRRQIEREMDDDLA